MSSEKTSNLQLHKWVGTDAVLRQEFNENFETLDAQLAQIALNIKTFGAKGDGVTDDTEAIEAAWAYITDPDNSRFASESGEPSYFVVKGPKLYFPPGEYVYSGTGLNLATGQSFMFNLEGVFQATKIKITSDAYFIDSDNNAVGYVFKNFQVYGGKGSIRFKDTGVNAARMAIIEGNVFSDYSVCAIASNSQDRPYIKIRDNFFRGKSGSTTIGIALAGYTAGSTIEDNVFHRNRYHIKFAPVVISGDDKGPSVPINIMKNDFLRIDTGNPNTFDVWIVPNQDTQDNAGRGCVFAFNKFGNESLQAGDSRVLIALESATGTDISDKQHRTDQGGGYISGVSFLKNNVNCNNGVIVPFIYSYTTKLFNFELNDIYDNSFPTYICQYDSTYATQIVSGSDTNIVNFNQSLSGQELASSVAVTNLPGTWKIIDPLGYAQGSDEAAQYYTGASEDSSYVNLLTTASTASMLKTNITTTAKNNSIGMVNEAAEVTMTASDGRMSGAVDKTKIIVGRSAFIEMDLARGTTNSLNYVTVEYRDSSNNVLFKRRVDLTTNWKRVRFKIVPTGSIADYYIRVTSPDYVAASRETFQIGRLAFYHAHEPVNNGHVKSLDSSWSKQHLVLGVYHLWIDATGDLRIKSSAPTSDLDGTVVGAQS